MSSQPTEPPSELLELVPLAQALVGLLEAPADFGEVAGAALKLAEGLQGSLRLFVALDEALPNSELPRRLLELPTELAQANETEHALAVAHAFGFLAPEKLRGDVAIIYALAGRRDEALAQVAANLEAAQDATLAEAKAGDAYRALGEIDAAEAYYRRSLAEATGNFDRAEAVLRIASLLLDAGRDHEASQFVAAEAERLSSRRAAKGEP